MSQSPKEIAENTIKYNQIFTNIHNKLNLYIPDSEFVVLARAYLELEKAHNFIQEQEVQNDVYIETLLMEIDKRGSEITKLKEELAAEKADKQRVLDIGVKMQREVNDRLEAKNASLIEALEHIASPKHWAVDTFVPEIRDRVKISRDALKKWGGV